MDLKKIKVLLEKYYKGESTPDEEKILIEYFSQGEISDELLADRDIFLYNKSEKKKLEEMPDLSAEIWNSLQKSSNSDISIEKKMIYWSFRIAAGIAILVVSFFMIKSQLQENQNGEYQFADTYENPEEAYEQAKQTLLYVSAMFNNGTAHLEPINKINESTQKLSPLTSFNSGLNELNQIKKYEIANKYIKQ
jgi:hypothetical protein